MLNILKAKLTETSRPKKIQSLDGLRAISCLLVIIGHLSYLFSDDLKQRFGEYLGQSIRIIIGNQYTGVTIFFVLSGFLITNLLIREIENSGTINYKQFFLKRVFRIFPAYYCYLGILYIYLSYTGVTAFTAKDLMAAITYTYNYTFDLNPWHWGHFWSLAIEEQFYLIWPLLFLFGYKRLGIKLPWVIILISPILRIATYYLFPDLRGLIKTHTHTQFDSLMFGCLLAYYYNLDFFPKMNHIIKKFKLYPASIFFVFFFSRLLQVAFKGSYTLVLGYSLDCLFICVMIIYLVENKTASSRFLNRPTLVHLGTLSYSIYLWQQPFTWFGLGTSNVFMRIFAIYGCALISYFLIESPFMALREKYFQQKQMAKKEPQILPKIS